MPEGATVQFTGMLSARVGMFLCLILSPKYSSLQWHTSFSGTKNN